MNTLLGLSDLIDRVNRRLGHAVAWLALAMVLAQFALVVLRYAFGIGSVAMQESVVYLHALVFLGTAGYALLANAHVRCDILYARAPARLRAAIDLFGVLVLLAPTCLVIAWAAWPYVTDAWAVREGSPEGGLGLPAVYLLKSTILLFAATLLLQGVSLGLRALAVLLGHAPVPPAAPGDTR